MKKTFEEKLGDLESIVKDLESGNIPLNEAIQKYQKATLIAKECSDELTSAEETVHKILTENGELKEFTVEE